MTDYDSLAVRNPAGERFVRDAGRDNQDGSPILVVDRDGADALRFTAEPDRTGEAREYVDATAFDRESLLVVQRAVTACHRLVVDYVARPDDSLEVGFCTGVRDAAVDCDTDDRHVVAAFVRLPFGLDGPPADGFSVRGGSTCLAPRTRTAGTTRGS